MVLCNKRFGFMFSRRFESILILYEGKIKKEIYFIYKIKKIKYAKLV